VSPELRANTLWSKLNSQDFVAGLGALTGNQAIQEVGLDAIYLRMQAAADANVAGKCILTNLYHPRTAFQ
jgi:isocitrate lyase